MTLTQPARELLIALAQQAIAAGRDAPAVGVRARPSDYPAELHTERASFVTLTTAREGLRGCRGALDPTHPLYADVWRNARASAFDDPRFPPVRSAEIRELQIEISVLGPLEPIAATSEAELLQLLVPGRDGIVLACGARRVTFLPKVWDMLPAPEDFLAQLKLKAGWPREFWAPEMRVWRYAAETFGDGPSPV